MKKYWLLPAVALLGFACGAKCDSATYTFKASVLAVAESQTAPPPAPDAFTNPKEDWVVSTSISRPAKAAGVPNFGKLNDHIWRSGQPSRAGYKLLASQGLKTVVNLRSEFPQDKDLIPAGVNYIYIPIPDEHAPTKEQAEKFMKFASDPANWPLLVHCHAGEGRAGTMAALVRCTLDRWDYETVMKETNNFRPSHFMGIRIAMASSQRQFIQKWQSDVAAASTLANGAAALAGQPIGTAGQASEVKPVK